MADNIYFKSHVKSIEEDEYGTLENKLNRVPEIFDDEDDDDFEAPDEAPGLVNADLVNGIPASDVSDMVGNVPFKKPAGENDEVEDAIIIADQIGKYTSEDIDELMNDYHNGTIGGGSSSTNNIVLSTLEDVTNNTESGKLVDAMVIKEVFQDVDSKKQLLASIATDKNVQTDADSDFDTILANLSKIKVASGNASASDVLSGKTFTNDSGEECEGTMKVISAATKSLKCGSSFTIPEGYHDGNGKVKANSLASQTPATASDAAILKDSTAWVNGEKITGIMANHTGARVVSNTVSKSDSYIYIQIPMSGFYDTTACIAVKPNVLSEILK